MISTELKKKKNLKLFSIFDDMNNYITFFFFMKIGAIISNFN